MQVKDSFFYFLVPLFIAVIVHKGNKLLPCRQLFGFQRTLVFFFQQGFQGVVFQQDKLLFTGQTEFRVYVQCLDMLANQPLAEGMEGADIRPREQHHLSFQLGGSFGIRGCCYFFFQRSFNAFAHFGSRRIGKGHHQQLVNIQFPFDKLADNTLYQHLGFAGPGGSRYQNIPATLINGFLLILGV